MSIAFYCVSCQHLLKVPESLAGKRGKCVKCGALMIVPAAPAPAPTVPVGPMGSVPSQQPPPLASMPSAPPAYPPPPPPLPAYGTTPPIAPGMPPMFPPTNPGNPFGDFGTGAMDGPLIQPSYRRRRSGLKLFLLLLFFFLILGGGGFSAYWFFFRAAGLDEEEKYFPNGVQMVASVRPSDFLGSSTWKDVKTTFKGAGDAEKEAGTHLPIKPDEVERVTLAINADFDLVVMIRTKKEIKAADILSTIKKEMKGQEIKFNESKVAGATLYDPDSGGPFAFCVVNSKLVVGSNKAKTIKAVLERGKKPEFSSSFKTAYEAADPRKTVFLAVAVPELFGKFKDMDPQQVAGLIPDPMAGGMVVGGLTQMKAELADMEGLALDLDVGSDIAVRATSIFKDAKIGEAQRKQSEEQMKTAKQMMAAAPKEVAGMLDNLKVGGSGKNVTLTMSFKLGPLLKLANEGKK